MSLVLVDCVSAIIRKAEDVTSGKIVPVEKSDLPVLARIELTDNPHEHHLMYRADHDEDINYVVANQCCHIMRLFGVEEESRFLPVSSRQSMMTYLLQVEGELKKLETIYGRANIKQFVLMWYQGLIFQLTKMPTDIMIDKWLYYNCPELIPVQKSSLEKQRSDAVRSLDPQWQGMAPSIVYYASNVMNYVYFKILEDLFQADFTGPYHSTLFIMDGRELVNRTLDRELTDDHNGDRKRIDSWAELLNLSGWYEWVPFREHPGPANMFSG